MKLRTFAAACVLAISFANAGAALAADPVVAKLQQPVAAKTKVIAGGAQFVCEGGACVATAPSSKTYALTTCKDLAKSFGAITAFGAEQKQLDDQRLAQCNSVAAATQVAKN
jgi:hypothetical protein